MHRPKRGQDSGAARHRPAAPLRRDTRRTAPGSRPCRPLRPVAADADGQDARSRQDAHFVRLLVDDREDHHIGPPRSLNELLRSLRGGMLPNVSGVAVSIIVRVGQRVFARWRIRGRNPLTSPQDCDILIMYICPSVNIYKQQPAHEESPFASVLPLVVSVSASSGILAYRCTISGSGGT